jgi:nitrite reductase (NADH) large subunit
VNGKRNEAEPKRLIVVGNGMAGLRFVEELLARADGRYRISIVGKETQPAYNRVLLSSLLAGEVSSEDVRFRDRGWYAEHGIELILGTPADGIDADVRLLHLADGRQLGFDRLVLATGSQPLLPAIPGMTLPGVLTFRDLADVDAIRAAARGGRRAVVIGGGLLGIEAAYGLVRAGLEVSLVHLMDRLMERQLDPRAGQLLRTAVEANGIRVILHSETEAIEGHASAEAVRLKGGRLLPADLVVVAVGIRPETTLARQAGIACKRGIIVDDSLATSVAGIYALGECAEHRGVCYGLVEPCYTQARILADLLSGGNDSYAGSVLATNLKVSGVGVFSTGDFLGEDGTEEIILSDPGLPAYKKLVIRRSAEGQQLIGAVLFGDIADGLWYQQLIRSATPVGAKRADLIFGRDFVEAAA